MIRNIGIGDTVKLKPSEGLTGKGFLIKAGTVIKAQVVDITDSGDTMLRIISAGRSQKDMQGVIIKAFSEIPLTKGQNVFLEVLGGKDTVRMQFIGDVKESSVPLQQNIPVKILDMLARLSESRLGNSEFKTLLNMLKTLPSDIKAAIPEFGGLEKLLLDTKELNGNVLRAFVETSGVAFETKLKIAVLRDPKSVLQNIIAFQSEGDLKGLLLKLSNLLKDSGVVETLTQAGLKISDMANMVEKFTRNIEFLQLTSNINDMFYTFMPVLWDGLRDGEFIFRKNKNNENASYTCDINLDLEKLGKLSVSVTSIEKEFYITFFIEQPKIAALVTSEKKTLEERFASQGLLLKAINVNHKKKIDFGKTQHQKMNIRV